MASPDSRPVVTGPQHGNVSGGICLAELDAESLTDRQFWLAGWCAVKGYPRVLAGTGEKRVAANLARLGWGTVENGGSGERIFRLNQAGEDAFSWLRPAIFVAREGNRAPASRPDDITGAIDV